MTGVGERAGLLPAAGAGLALLAFGAFLLLGAGALAPADPVTLAFWTVGVGVLILLGAVLVTLLRTIPVEPPVVAPRAERAATPSRVATVRPRPAAVVPVESPPPEIPRPVVAARPAPGSSSIPAQYVHLLPEPSGWTAAAEPPTWDESEMVSLPFSAGPRGMSDDLPPMPGFYDAPPPSVGELTHEVEVLRERVRELELPVPAVSAASAVPVRPSLFVGGRPPEPPKPSVDGPRRQCTGCGSGLPGGATDPLCWGCGRPLCATCYWRTKDGPAAHTCPACFARTDGTSRSGGRGPSAVTPVVSAPGSAMATGRR